MKIFYLIDFSDGGDHRVQRDEGVPEEVPQDVRRRGKGCHQGGHPGVLPEHEIGQTPQSRNPEILSLKIKTKTKYETLITKTVLTF